MPKLNSEVKDYRQALIEEVKSLPEELLPKVYELIRLISDKRLKVSQIVQQAHKIAQEKKAWSRHQHMDELLEVAKRIRQETINKGVAIDKESEAVNMKVSLEYVEQVEKLVDKYETALKKLAK